ncbi:hypothetical protein [Vagococcus sp.]|uniref:hypothetical protein n=1 Tax=Vagococcus sp. TaxID=1933889 RepID=UPI003F94A8C9
MKLNEFLKLGEEKAVKYDFFNESVNPDNSVLIKEIYKKLFPWYKEMPLKYSGDTMNTYKRAIWCKEKDSGNKGKHDFICLSESKKKDYLNIVKRHTKELETYCFGIKTYGMYKNEERILTIEIFNNHQLGNFWPLPLTKAKNGTMNTLKNSECNDYMDVVLKKIDKYFNEKKVGQESGFIVDFSNSNDYLPFFDSKLIKGGI